MSQTHLARDWTGILVFSNWAAIDFILAERPALNTPSLSRAMPKKLWQPPLSQLVGSWELSKTGLRRAGRNGIRRTRRSRCMRRHQASEDWRYDIVSAAKPLLPGAVAEQDEVAGRSRKIIDR